MQKITPSHRKDIQKKNIRVTERLFYFNNELRLEHNTVERKTNQNIYITSDEKIKKEIVS
jgi:hypothetical protein